jgi:hypothetical protein
MRKPFKQDFMQTQHLPQGRCVTRSGDGLSILQVLEQQRARQMTELEAVLAELVATGWVLEQKGTDGRTRFGVNPQTLSDIGARRNEPFGPVADIGSSLGACPVAARAAGDDAPLLLSGAGGADPDHASTGDLTDLFITTARR